MPWLTGGMVLAGLLAATGYYYNYAQSNQAPPLPYDLPKLPTTEIRIGDVTATVEIADRESTRRHGLKFRKGLAPNHGMLFVFEAPDWLSFWMQNTQIPLDIAYIDQNGNIINILTMTPFDVTPDKYKSGRKALYALEMTKGWFERNRIEPGDVVVIPESISRKSRPAPVIVPSASG